MAYQTKIEKYFRVKLLCIRYYSFVIVATLAILFVFLLSQSYIVSVSTAPLSENDENGCPLQKPENTVQRKGKYCMNECIPWAQMLSANSDDILDAGYSKVSNICQGEDAINCVQAFRDIDDKSQFFWTMKPMKTVLCTMPKTSSQLMTAVMCLLNDELNFFYLEKEIFGNYYSVSCGTNRIKNVVDAVARHGSEVYIWTKLTVVREPIDRFLSAFLFACVRGHDEEKGCTKYCYGCGANLTCFVEKTYKNIMNLSNGAAITDDFLARHQYPQTWRCDMHKYLRDYTIIKHSSDPELFVPRVLDFLKSKNVSSLALNYIKHVALSERTHHTTSNTNARKFYEERLRSSPYLMEKIVRIYYHDFKVFGFPLPEGFE